MRSIAIRGTCVNYLRISSKAYWPELVDKIDEISNRRMPASRLVSLAFRVILSETDGKLAAGQSVSSIRKLAKEKDESKQTVCKKILDFINAVSEDTQGLEACCKRIDQWLGTEPETSWGLPLVLRTSIAHQKPDLYLLLLLLARQNPSKLDESCCKLLTGAITYAMWFCSDTTYFTKILYAELKEASLTDASILNAVKKVDKSLYLLHKPVEIENFLKIPSAEVVENWKFWPDSIQDKDPIIQNKNEQEWWYFLCIIRGEKELLLYAQRDFLRKRFPNYDPARKDLWEAHNRPWDFDHILPSAYIYRKKSGIMPFCREWCNTIGNLRAWPFEDNRSAQDQPAGEKIGTSERMIASFINENEMGGFNQKDDIGSDPEKAILFANSCKSRIIRIYEEWFKALGIEKFIFEHSS